MEADPMDWLPHSFSRRPAWRVLRAEHRNREQVPPDPRVDDEWTEVALQLLRSPGTFEPGHPVRAALALWAADRESRWLLEAQLLTSRTCDEVATACALPAPVVRAYHELFFDVRPRLAARDWVMARAVRCGPFNEFAGPQPAGLWKYAAYTGGPRVLDAVVAVTLDRPLPPRLSETFVTNPAVEEQLFRAKVRLTLAIMTARSVHQLEALARLSERLRALRVAAGLEAREGDRFLPKAVEVLSALVRSAGTKPKAARAMTGEPHGRKRRPSGPSVTGTKTRRKAQ